MIRTISADNATPGLADVVFRMRSAKGQITVIGDPDADFAIIKLAPARPGDRTAEEAIDTAQYTGEGARLAVTVPKPQTRTQTTVTSPGADMPIITGSAVIAANIGGVGNVGHIGGVVHTTASAPESAGVWAEITVPAGSDVYIVAQGADVLIRGKVRSETDTAGIVRTEPL